jgi:hypothetical protein
MRLRSFDIIGHSAPLRLEIIVRCGLPALAVIVLTLAVHARGEAQEPSPERFDILGSMETAAADVSAGGEKAPTVEFTPVRIELSDELKPMAMSGSFTPGNRMIDPPDASVAREGFFSRIAGISGTRTLGELNAAGSWGTDDRAGTLRGYFRSRNENTPTNLAPSVRTLEGSGYLDTGYGRFALDLGATAEKEGAMADRFRSRDRKMNLYSFELRGNPVPGKSWTVNERIRFEGADYHDGELAFDRSGSDITGSVAMSREGDDLSVSVSAEGCHAAFGAASGSLLALGGTAGFNPIDPMRVTAGADFTLYGSSGHGAKARLTPTVSAEWAVSPRSFLKLNAAPRVILHSFNDLYRMNGLVTQKVPLVFEERTLDLSAEYGCALDSEFAVDGRVFLTRSVHPPLFGASGAFFDVIGDSRVTVKGGRAEIRWEPNARRGVESSMTVRSAGWTHPGKVPFLPSWESETTGHVEVLRDWTFRSTLRLTAGHATGNPLTGRVSGFGTLDAGAERRLFGGRASLTLDMRNLLNSDGAWWSEEYPIPGIGLYAGIRADY